MSGAIDTLGDITSVPLALSHGNRFDLNHLVAFVWGFSFGAMAKQFQDKDIHFHPSAPDFTP